MAFNVSVLKLVKDENEKPSIIRGILGVFKDDGSLYKKCDVVYEGETREVTEDPNTGQPLGDRSYLVPVEGEFKGIYVDGDDHYDINFKGKFNEFLPIGKATGCIPLLTETGDIACLYKGEFEDGKMEGHGEITYKGMGTYKGEYKNGKMDGRGKFTRRDGSIVYEGEYKNGKMDGRGKITYKDGSTYEGEFKNGRIEGRGKFTRRDGSLVYEGEYKDNLRNGHGKATYENGNIYEGEFKNGKRDGHGKVTFKGGDTYDGEFKNGEMDGYGKYAYEDGSTYEGEFKNGEMEGHGKFTYKNGNTYEGETPDYEDEIKIGTFTVGNTKYSGCFCHTRSGDIQPMDGIMRVEDMATGDVKYAKFKDGKEGKEVSEKKFRKSCDKKLGKGGYEKFSEEMKKIEEMGNKRKKARQDTTHRITEQEQPVNSRKSNVLDAFKGIVGGVTSSASFQSGTPNLPNTKNPKTNKDKAR